MGVGRTCLWLQYWAGRASQRNARSPRAKELDGGRLPPFAVRRSLVGRHVTKEVQTNVKAFPGAERFEDVCNVPILGRDVVLFKMWRETAELYRHYTGTPWQQRPSVDNGVRVSSRLSVAVASAPRHIGGRRGRMAGSGGTEFWQDFPGTLPTKQKKNMAPCRLKMR